LRLYGYVYEVMELILLYRSTVARKEVILENSPCLQKSQELPLSMLSGT